MKRNRIATLIMLLILTVSVSLSCYPETTVTMSGTVPSSMIPTADNVFNIGSPAMRWANGYFGGGINATGGTLTNTTLTTPTIGSFANANHTHASAAQGGQLTNPQINEAVAMTVTSSELNKVDDTDFIMVSRSAGLIPNINLNTGWSETNVGSGDTTYSSSYQTLVTGLTANSSTFSRTDLVGTNLTAGQSWTRINWSKSLEYFLILRRSTSEAETIARMQIKETNAIGQLASLGVGIQIDNLALTGESYGAAGRGTVNLATSLVSGEAMRLKIVHTPATSVTFYKDIGGGWVSIGSIVTANLIPAGNGAAVPYLCFSIANGVTGGTNAQMQVAESYTWLQK